MDVVVTGASGFIGSALVPALEADGHRVARLLRDGNGDGDTLRWDPVAGRIDAAGMEGVDAVVHLAGAGIGDKRWTEDRKREIRESRTKGTALLAGTLAKLQRKPAVIVSASAVGYYGDRGDEELTEDSPPRRRLRCRCVRRLGSSDRARPATPGSGSRLPGAASCSPLMAACSNACCCRSSSASAGAWGTGAST